MALEIITENNTQIVLLPQRFDATTAPGIETDLKALLATTQGKIIFDFSRTDYVATRPAGSPPDNPGPDEAGGKVALVEIRPPVLKVFEMAGFTSIFPISKTRADALLKMA